MNLLEAQNFEPPNLYRASLEVPETDKVTHIRHIEALEGQARSLDIAERQLKISSKLAKLQGLRLELENETIRNQIIVETGRLTEVQLAQAQVKTGIELAKLEGLKHDLTGYQATAGLTGKKWSIAIKSLELQVEQQAQELAVLEAQVSYLPGGL